MCVLLLDTGLLSVLDGLGRCPHAGSARIGNFTCTIDLFRQLCKVPHDVFVLCTTHFKYNFADEFRNTQRCQPGCEYTTLSLSSNIRVRCKQKSAKCDSVTIKNKCAPSFFSLHALVTLVQHTHAYKILTALILPDAPPVLPSN